MGTPYVVIQTRESSDSIAVKAMNDQSFQYIENETSEQRTVKAWWNSNNSVQAQAAFIFPIPAGEYSVNISCEGLQSVDHIGGNRDGYWIGLIAYQNQSGDYWGVGNYVGCDITNLLGTNTWRPGHEDLELNGCKFTDGQIVERDAVISFHVKARGADPKFYLMAPKTMKSDKYNYVVSYGGYTDKRMEFGSISVTVDESDVEAQRYNRHTSTVRRTENRDYGWLSVLPTYDPNQVPEREEEQPMVDKEMDSKSPVKPLSPTSDTEAERAFDLKEEELTRARLEYEAATESIPDAAPDILPSKSEMSSRPIDYDGRSLPKPQTKEILGTYQGQNITPDDVPPVIAEKLREVSRAPSTLLYDRQPKQPKSFLSRFVETNKTSLAPPGSQSSTSGMTREQASEYTRIRRSLGLTAAKEYKASLANTL